MVQEVKRREAELNLLVLLEVEVLVDSEIAIEERGTVDIRPDDVAVSAAGGRREAGWIEVLAGAQAAARIAGDLWSHGGERVCAQYALRRKAAGPLHVQVALSIGLDRRPTLHLSDAGKLPAIHNPAKERVALDGTRKVDDIGGVEDVRMVPTQNAVILCHGVRIQ